MAKRKVLTSAKMRQMNAILNKMRKVPRLRMPRAYRHLCALLIFEMCSSLGSAQGPRGDTRPLAVEDLVPNDIPTFPEEKLGEIIGLLSSRQLAAAEQRIEEERRWRPNDATLLTLLGEVRLDQRRYRESLALLETVRKQGGESARLWTLAGLDYVALRHADQAEPMFREAIRLNPDSASAHYYLGRQLYTANRFAEAIEQTQIAVRLSPDLIAAYDNLGLCYWGQQRTEAAEKYFLEAIARAEKLQIKAEWPSLNLATMLLQQGETKAALPHLNRALQIDPDSSPAHFEMGVLLEKEGELSRALEEYAAATKLDRTLAKAHYRAARIYVRLREPDKAAEELDSFRETENANNAKP